MPGFVEAIGVLESLDAEWRANMQRVDLATVENALGRPRAALERIGAAVTSFHASNDVGRAALALANAATYHAILNEIEEAAHAARQGLLFGQRAQFSAAVARSIQHLATVAIRAGSQIPAYLNGYAENWYRAAGFGREAAEQTTYETKAGK